MIVLARYCLGLAIILALLACSPNSPSLADSQADWEPDETSRVVDTLDEAEALAEFRPLVPTYVPDSYQLSRTSVRRLQHPPGSARDYTYLVTTTWLPVEPSQGPPSLGLTLTQSSAFQDLEEILEHGPPDEYLGDWVGFGQHRGVLTPQVSLHGNTSQGHAMTLRIAPEELPEEELLRVAESLPID